MSEQFINLQFCGPCILTPEEYEQIEKAVMARALVGCNTPGDRVLAILLTTNRARYNEIRLAK
jgi:hypothetical protein